MVNTKVNNILLLQQTIHLFFTKVTHNLSNTHTYRTRREVGSVLFFDSTFIRISFFFVFLSSSLSFFLCFSFFLSFFLFLPLINVTLISFFVKNTNNPHARMGDMFETREYYYGYSLVSLCAWEGKSFFNTSLSSLNISHFYTHNPFALFTA